ERWRIPQTGIVIRRDAKAVTRTFSDTFHRRRLRLALRVEPVGPQTFLTSGSFRVTKFRILCLFICCVAFANSAAQKGRGDWRFYGHDPGGMRYSELKQVNRSNVARLQPAWIYHTGEIKRL